MITRKPPFATPAITQSGDSGPGLATDSPAAEMRPLDAPKRVNRHESSDSYSDVVAVPNPKWRVIRCREGIQSILQSRDSVKAAKGIWRGRSCCRTKEALLRVCAAHAGKIDRLAAAALAALPDWIEASNLPSRSPTTRSAAEEQN